MIIQGVHLPNPQYNDQETTDLRIITNTSINNSLHQARLDATNGDIRNFVCVFFDCDGKKDALEAILQSNKGNPIGIIIGEESMFGLLIDSDFTLTEDRQKRYALNLSYYVIQSGEFNPLLDPDDEWLLDPDGMPLEAP